MRHLRGRFLRVLLAFAVAGSSGLAQQIPDTTPPFITSAPTPSLIAFTTADIFWTTDEPSAGRLELARSPDDPQPFVLHFEEVFLASWRVTLYGLLTPGTIYYVRVVLWDQFGNGPTISPWVSFRTLGENPPGLPVITSGPTPSLIGFTTADIVWTTDEPSGGRLELGRSLEDPQPVVVHFENNFLASWRVTLSGLLTPHTTYYVRVVLWDEWGNGPTTSPWVPFRTLGDDPPTANAGPDQSISYGQLVTLDGSGSFDDNTPTSGLQFQWTLRTPHDGLAMLSNPHVMSPTFVADLPGLYEASLTVIDNGRQSSLPDTVQISSVNLAPTADAGNAVSGYVGGVVTFDGTASRDPEGGGLLSAWEVVSRPDGSSATLDDPQSPTPSLIPDLAGEYRLQLVVRDQWGLVSAPAETAAMIVKASQYAESLIVSAQQQVSALPGGTTLINEGHRTALTQFLTNALRASARGDEESVLRDLESALLRVDGCARRGAVDGAGPDLDWISGCAEQKPIYQRLADALTVLQ